jgi:hypothetical protein
MCGEEHADALLLGRRPASRVRNTDRLLDDLVVVRPILKALGYSAGSAASFTMSIQPAACAVSRN